MQSFLQALSQLRQGDFVRDCADELHELCKEVARTAKKGELNIKLVVSPQGPGSPLKIDDKIVTKLPQPETGSTFMFLDEDGELTRRDPRQPDLPLKLVKASEDDPKHDPETGEIIEDEENGTDG